MGRMWDKKGRAESSTELVPTSNFRSGSFDCGRSSDSEEPHTKFSLSRNSDFTKSMPSSTLHSVNINRFVNGQLIHSIYGHDWRHRRVEENKKDFQTQNHAVPIDSLYREFGTNPYSGLTDDQVEINLLRYGPNHLTPMKRTSKWMKYLQNLVGGFAVLLWIAAFLCFFVYLAQCTYEYPPPLDFFYLGVALLAVVLLSGTFSYIQEYQNDQILESFKNMVPNFTTVIRNGEASKINVVDLVVGDIVEVKSGDRIPADIRIIESHGLKVDNSSLTGEIEPLLRVPECTHDDPQETYNLAFFSTCAVEGFAKGLVILTGDKTLVGRIANLTSGLDFRTTPLSKEMNYFVKILCARALFFGIIFFIIAFSMGYTWFDSVFFLIGVIVANVPEGLLSFITICLALTAKRMTKKSCLVKHLHAVETLGSTSTICSDKTGTLTQSKMTVSHIVVNNQIFTVDTSELRTKDKRFDHNNKSFKALAAVAILCSRATFKPNQKGIPISQRAVNGDASEAAILKCMESQLGHVEIFRRERRKLFEIPFNAKNKYQISIHHIDDPRDPHLLLVMKGAPERILELCSSILIDGEEVPLTENWREIIEKHHTYLGNLGERVFGFCDLRLPLSYGQGAMLDADESQDLFDHGFRHVGLMSMLDPPRSGVPDAVLKCRSAGIRVVMITGDLPITAKAIARAVGIFSEGNETADEVAERLNIRLRDVDTSSIKAAVIDGKTLKGMTEAQLDAAISQYKEIVFARTSPQQKLTIVEAFQRQNQIVAVTGDGVNDSPALKKADIGIAMGITGTDVAKEVADMILLDDNFASIVFGVEEGRLIFDNLKKCSFYALTDNIAELLPFFAIVILRVPLALGTVAMLMIDLGTDVLPAISLAYEKPENDIMKQLPRDSKKDRLITNKLISYSYAQIGMFEALAGFFTYLVILGQSGFLPLRLWGIQPLWDSQAINDLEDSYGQEWTFVARKKLEYTCYTGYFVSVVIVQWANLIICKTRRVSIFNKGMRNWFLNSALIFETALAVFLSYCPGMDAAFKMYPLKPEWWFPAIPFALLILFYDEGRRYILRHYKGGWFEKEFYY